MSFAPPLNNVDSITPLLLADHGRGEVAISTVGSYDPVDRYYTWTPTVRKLIEGDRDLRRLPDFAELIRRITTHLLYADAVAIEYTDSISWIATQEWAALRFVQTCAALEPLIDANILIVTPCLSDLGIYPARHRFSGTPDRPDEIAIDEAMTILGGYRTYKHGEQELPAESDPLGPLDGPYWSAYEEHVRNGVREDEMRGLRAYDRIEVLIDALKVTTMHPHLDPFMTPAEIPILQKLLSMETERYTSARKADKVIGFAEIFDLDIPVGRLSVADLAAIRRNGEFDAFRQGLQSGLREAKRQGLSLLVDPRAAQLREIQQALTDSRNSMRSDIKKSNFLSTSLDQSGNLLVASAAGTLGTAVQSPMVGALLGGSTYLAEVLIKWLVTKSRKATSAYVRHVSVFTPPR